MLSLVVLGAHFLRAGNLFMVGLILLLLGLLGIRRPWAARTVQAALLLGAAEWIRTLVRLAGWRADAGKPILRLVLILASVALVTGLSSLMFRTARVRSWFQTRLPVSTANAGPP